MSNPLAFPAKGSDDDDPGISALRVSLGSLGVGGCCSGPPFAGFFVAGALLGVTATGEGFPPLFVFVPFGPLAAALAAFAARCCS